MMGTKKSKGYLMILASAVCFASTGVWCRILGKNFGIFYQGWVKSLIILMVIIPIAILKKSFKPIKKPHFKWFAVTIISSAFTQVPFYFAFNHLPLGLGTLVFYGLFLITSYAIGWVFLSEKISSIKIISLILSLAGLILTFGVSWAAFSISGLFLAALSGIASGTEVATSKKSSAHYSSLQIVTYAWIVIFLTHLPISLITRENQLLPAFNLQWAAMLAYAACSLGGFWLVIEGFRHVDASIGGLIGLLEIVFSALFGVLLFQDHLSLPIILGGLIILASAILPDVYALKHRGESPNPPHPPI